MRPFPIACCALAAISGSALFGGANIMRANNKPASDVSPLMKELAKLPESERETQCVFADPFRGHRVAAGKHSVPPEYRRYLQCLLSEARRDGGRVRLASASSFPKVGTCYSTRITAIGARFGGAKPDHDAGTSVEFNVGIRLVDYSCVSAVARSRVGDNARVCVYALPEDCPADDLRGIEYRARNLRTGESWIMSDSQHGCRGA